MPLADPVIVQRARRLGPLPWSALGPGPLRPLPEQAGPVLGAWVDGVWEDLGRPDPLVVVDQGGRVAEVVAVQGLACAPALRWVSVDPPPAAPDRRPAAPDPTPAADPALRQAAPASDPTAAAYPTPAAQQAPTAPSGGARRGPIREAPSVVLGPSVAGHDPDDGPVTPPGIGPLATTVTGLPAGLSTAVVIAAATVSALASDRYEEHNGRWWELRLAAGDTPDRLEEVRVEVPVPRRPGSTPRSAPGSAPRRWLRAARAVAESGVVLVVDDGATVAGLPVGEDGRARAVRPPGDLSPLIARGWTMTRGGHAR